MTHSKKLEERLDRIIDEIKANNPYETFEPHEAEEGQHDIMELYEARLRKLICEKVCEDEELRLYFLNLVADELEREH